VACSRVEPEPPEEEEEGEGSLNAKGGTSVEK